MGTRIDGDANTHALLPTFTVYCVYPPLFDIIRRVEVIGKQIAFLSKETEGQPDKVLAAGNNNRGASSSSSADQHSQSNVYGNVNSNKRDDGDSDDVPALGGGDGDGDGTGTLATSGAPSSPLGAPFAARVEFYRRVRRGLVTHNELLPESMLLSATAVSAGCSPGPSPGERL